uniref:ATP synthase complex subunit 8 n=1 Tax=Diadema setosum TaxID=31175 RepID=Q8W8D3_DIASE|nr:ATP8 [Diadema setosum]AAG47213.1 ATP8 [Diadema setosum]AAG47239.1 ATP8 [Diadema setosum]AAG47317.1 ATP8 [Diadema setosum]
MPQLDFSWWLVNFALIWTAVTITFVIISNNVTSSKNSTPSNENESIQKNTTEWQWS